MSVIPSRTLNSKLSRCTLPSRTWSVDQTWRWPWAGEMSLANSMSSDNTAANRHQSLSSVEVGNARGIALNVKLSDSILLQVHKIISDSSSTEKSTNNIERRKQISNWSYHLYPALRGAWAPGVPTHGCVESLGSWMLDTDLEEAKPRE